MVAGVEFAFADVCKLCGWRQDFVCPFQQIFLADGVGADVVASWLEDGHLNLVDVVDVTEYFQRS